MTYAELREMTVQGVIRGLRATPSLDRIRAVFDASFFQVNSTVAEAFAAVHYKRELLRTVRTLTFIDGLSTLNADVLKKYVEDGTLAVGVIKYTYLPYPQYVRTFDKRLGYWTVVGDVVQAKKPTNGLPLTGDANSTFISSPPVPTGENDTFLAPEDYISDLLGALVEYVRGQMQEVAAQTA